MKPAWIIVASALQLALLYWRSPSPTALAAGIGVVLILLLFAFTRNHWDAHLDMILIMLAPGGLGMLLPLLFMTGPLCHSQNNPLAFLEMSLGMLLFSVPLSWFQARCILEARRQGRGVQILFLDVIGMQIGMTLAHVPMTMLPMNDPRAAWLHHASMLVGMLLGMLCSMLISTISFQNRAVLALPDDYLPRSSSTNRTGGR